MRSDKIDPNADVLIVGAGPAGCAAALALAAHAPDLAVCLIDEVGAARTKVGDTVPPTLMPILQHLGLWHDFLASGHRAEHRAAVAWGNSYLISNEHFFLGNGPAWQIDRAAFEASLRRAVLERGVLLVPGRVVHCRGTERDITVQLQDGRRIAARYGLDATGRAAALSRSLAGPSRSFEVLIAAVVYGPDRRTERNELTVEAVPEGWWYTSGLPGGRRVTSLLTDTDQVRQFGLTTPAGFRARLAQTRHIRAVHGESDDFDIPRLHPAGSKRSPIRIDAPLLPIGDAGIALDPVCGQGIVNALRTGIFAAYAVGDWLGNGDASGLQRYRAMIDTEFAEYQVGLTRIYAAETRWPKQPFWHCRHKGQAQSEVSSH